MHLSAGSYLMTLNTYYTPEAWSRTAIQLFMDISGNLQTQTVTNPAPSYIPHLVMGATLGVKAVPEPATWALMALGLVGLMGLQRAKRRG